MGKRSAEDLWKRIVAEAGEDEIERAASVSVAQAESDLAGAGFDVAAERARSEVRIRSLEGNAARGRAAKARPRRDVPSIAWVGAAAAAAGIAVSTYSATHGRDVSTAPSSDAPSTTAPSSNAPSSSPSGAPSDWGVATDLRRRASVACDAGRAKECLALLDRAREIDAAGDQAVDVQRMRVRAREELGTEPR